MITTLKHTGGRIQARRKLLLMPQYKLADKIGISRTVMSRYEKNQSTPSAFILGCIADALGVSVDWLLCREHKAEWEINQKDCEEEFPYEDDQDQILTQRRAGRGNSRWRLD